MCLYLRGAKKKTQGSSQMQRVLMFVGFCFSNDVDRERRRGLTKSQRSIRVHRHCGLPSGTGLGVYQAVSACRAHEFGI